MVEACFGMLTRPSPQLQGCDWCWGEGRVWNSRLGLEARRLATELGSQTPPSGWAEILKGLLLKDGSSWIGSSSVKWGYPSIYFLGDSTQGHLLDQEHQACPWAWGGPGRGSDDRG